jgi:hypothetical protein
VALLNPYRKSKHPEPCDYRGFVTIHSTGKDEFVNLLNMPLSVSGSIKTAQLERLSNIDSASSSTDLSRASAVGDW